MKRYAALRYLSLPAAMGLVFFLTFGGPGRFLCKILSLGISWWTGRFSAVLVSLSVSPPVQALVVDGICTGVGSVLSFLPAIGMLFFCLSLLESSGFLDQSARWLDGPMSHIGLPGSAVVPLLTGFGCSVPAILSAGQLQNPSQKLRAVFLVPFFSCSARLPIYSLIAGSLFPGRGGRIIAGLYLLGAGTGLLLAAAVQAIFPIAPFLPPQAPAAAPAFRRPSLQQALAAAWTEIKDFSRKAFTVIFLGSMIIWLLEHLDASLTLTDVPAESLLADLGRMAAPLFAPLGFGDWRAVSAVLSGLTAKEAVVSTLTVMLGEGAGRMDFAENLSFVFTPASAISFLIFCLFYTPCIAALAAVRKELGGLRWVLAMASFQCSFAWILSFLFFRVGI
ncbi:MAG: nucleoside recognition domain-containing protein [Anaerovoracaceae bacterium]